jgi:hypothetical protein
LHERVADWTLVQTRAHRRDCLPQFRRPLYRRRDSPKGVSLACGPFSGPEADDWLRDRKMARPDRTLTIDSLRTPMGCAAWREQTRETH